jgi:hypothetical protein
MVFRKTIWIGVGLIAALCAGSVLAGDAAMSDVSGGSVQLMDRKPSNVRMVSESVDMKLGAWGAKTGWPVFVRCQFFLKNNGPATDVTVGFPEHLTASYDGALGEKIKNFKSWVDGTPAVTKYTHLIPPKRKHVHEKQDYKAWYVAKVHFDAGQTRRVDDVYSSRLGGYDRPGWPCNQNLMGYTLQTGASWQGTVGSAVVKADLSDVGNFFDITAWPKGFARLGNVYTWKMTDFTPKEDIRIKFVAKAPVLIEPGSGLPDNLEPVFVKDSVLMVSSRIVSYDDRGIVQCDGKRGSLHRGGHVLELADGSKSATLDGRSITMKTAPVGYESDLAVPLDETVKLLGGTVTYDKTGRPKVIWPRRSRK